MAQNTHPKLEARHYILLQAIKQLGNMSAAAARLGVTPSAVTHRIREAERRLGVPLTARLGTQLHLTLAAQRLAEAADRALDEMFRAEFDAARIGKRGGGAVVRLGMATYNFFHWLPAFLKNMTAVDRDLQVEIVGHGAGEWLQLLQDNSVDVMLVPGPPRPKRGVTFLPLRRDELICITAASHPLASRRFIEAGDLTAETHLTYSSVVTEGFEYDRFFRPAGRYPARLVPLAVPEVVQELVAANLGISILSRWAAEPRLKRNEIAGIRLTKKGVDLQWQVAIRENEENNSPVAACAKTLLRWSK